MLTVKIAPDYRRDRRHLIDKVVMRGMPRARAKGGLIAETQARAGILHVGPDMLVGAVRYRIVAADQPGRVAVLPVVAPRDDMAALEGIDLGRPRPIADQDMMGWDSLGADAGMALAQPGFLGREYGVTT